MQYLLVKNWRDHQHYKKRSPPWIKLHRAIIEDYAFSTLKDKTKAHLILIWVLASGTEGRIPNDAKFIASKISAQETVDLDAMVEAGFLFPENGDQPIAASTNKSSGPMREDTGEVIQRVPIIGDQEFEVRESFVLELERLYPAVDIRQTLNEIRGYFIGKPQKRKTPRGIRGCITSWMGREQDKHGRA